MPPKGWKKNAQTGEWYDPSLVGEAPADESTSEVETASPAEPETSTSEVAETESVEERGQSLTKIPSKQRKFAKGT